MNKLEEIDPSEAQSTSGGFFDMGFVETIVAGLVIGAGVNIFENWDSFKAGLMGTPDPAAKSANK